MRRVVRSKVGPDAIVPPGRVEPPASGTVPTKIHIPEN